MKNLSYALVVGASFALAASAATAATVTIDDFRTAQSVSAPPANGVPSSSTINAPGAAAVGGHRTMTVSRTSGPNAVTLEVDTESQIVDFSAASRTRGTATISWFGDSSWTGVDLTDGGTNNAIFVRTVFADAELSLVWTVTDTAGHTGSLTYKLSEDVDFDDEGTYVDFDFVFTSFSGNVDFTSIKSLSLTLSSTAAAPDASFQLLYAGPTDDFVPVVPLPAAGWMLIGGAAALGAVGRRRR